MKIKLDGRRRVTIPTLFAQELGIKENSIIDIELIDNKIIIANPDTTDYKAIVDKARAFVEEFIQEDYYEELDEYITHTTWNTTKEDLLDILNTKKD